MTQIKVKFIPSHFVLEDYTDWHCKHANSEVIEVDFGSYNQAVEDYIDDWRHVVACTECFAIYDEYERRFVK